jgi:hypothetical protein
MKRIIWILIIPAVMSCSKYDKLPDDYLDKQEMVGFLIDLHLLQSQIQNLRLPNDSAEFTFLVLERELFDEYGYHDSLFYDSYSWYLNHPDQMFEIYTAVVDSLTLQQSLVRKDR